MGEKKQIKVLNDLLEATEEEEPKDYNFDKIVSLIEKTKAMKKEEKLRSQRANDYFDQLKIKLAESTAYLNKARKDMDNIKDRRSDTKFGELNSVEDYEELMKKSNEEIEEEMNQLKAQLELLDSKVKKSNQRSKQADEFYAKSMETLKTINQNLSGDH